MICDFGCDRLATHFFKSSKKWCCSTSVNSCPEVRARNSEAVKRSIQESGDSRWKNGHPRGNLGKHTLRGKTYEEIHGDQTAQDIRTRISASNLGNRSWDSMTEDQQEAQRQRARESINKRYAEGWMPKAGRCKKISYISPSAGEIRLDGNWELVFAKYLDRENLTWNRNTTRFPYKDETGKDRTYTPDFWVEEWNTYVEVKGYETALDRCKWSQFKENLQVWRRDRILPLLEDGQDGNAAVC